MRRVFVVGLLVAAVGLLPVAGWAFGSRFLDVDEANPHAEAIAWMDEHGLTAGCGDGSRYCPDEPVRRDQFASFVKRLAGARVVDAATVGGHSAAELVGPAGPAGPSGPSGPVGATGSAGAAGATGLAGPAGPKGDTGDAVLADVACTTDQVIRWDGTAWGCSDDADTLAGLSCSANQSVGWDGDDWVCRSAPIIAMLSTASSPLFCCTVSVRFDVLSPNVDHTGFCNEDLCFIQLVDVLDHTACMVTLSGDGAQSPDVIIGVSEIILDYRVGMWRQGESLFVNINCVA